MRSSDKFIIKILALLLPLIILFSCERDPLNNYRDEYAGAWDFVTVREDLSSGQPEILDTIFYTGPIEPIYSNRNDLIYIQFTSTGAIDAVVSETGMISLPDYRIAGGFETLSGGFNPGVSMLNFTYTFSSGDYSLRSTVEGVRGD